MFNKINLLINEFLSNSFIYNSFIQPLIKSTKNTSAIISKDLESIIKTAKIVTKNNNNNINNVYGISSL